MRRSLILQTAARYLIPLLFLFSIIDPTYTAPLFGTVLGWFALALIAVLDLMGLWLMFKLVKIEV